jgi:hypothetical protein
MLRNILELFAKKFLIFIWHRYCLLPKALMGSRVRVHLFGPGSIQKISEPQGKKTVSGELEAKQRHKRSAFLFVGFSLD